LQGFDSELRNDVPDYPLRRPGDAVPHLLFMAFQLGIFIAAAAPLVVCLSPGLALWGRMLFVTLWGTLVYAPIAYWIWGGGWHASTLDYAGGIVVQVTVGFSALALALVLAPPASGPEQPQTTPHLALLALGTVLFWAGSLITNASHSLSASAGSTNACVATHLAACTGILGWAGCEWLVRGTASPSGICAGAMAGLFTIAPACGYVAPQSALLIGVAAGVTCQIAWRLATARRGANPLLACWGSCSRACSPRLALRDSIAGATKSTVS
jgi:Amt family ammonium transporter